MTTKSVRSWLDENSRAVHVFSVHLREIGVSGRKFCQTISVSLSTFRSWMRDKNMGRLDGSGVGHRVRPPVKLLREILERAELPDHVAEALRAVVEYPKRNLIKTH